MAIAGEKKVAGILSPTSITTLYYLIKELMEIFTIGSLENAVIEKSLESKASNFKDAMLEGLTTLHAAECIATRNTRGFRKSRIPAKKPIEVI